MTAQSMSLTMNSLADLDHPENLNLELQTGKPIIDLHCLSLPNLRAILFCNLEFVLKQKCEKRMRRKNEKKEKRTRIDECTRCKNNY